MACRVGTVARMCQRAARGVCGRGVSLRSAPISMQNAACIVTQGNRNCIPFVRRSVLVSLGFIEYGLKSYPRWLYY